MTIELVVIRGAVFLGRKKTIFLGLEGGVGVAVQEKGLLVCGLAGLLEDVSSRGAAVTGCSGCIRPAVVIGKFTN